MVEVVEVVEDDLEHLDYTGTMVELDDVTEGIQEPCDPLGVHPELFYSKIEHETCFKRLFWSRINYLNNWDKILPLQRNLITLQNIFPSKRLFVLLLSVCDPFALLV